MILQALLAFLPPILIGCLVVILAWPGSLRRDLGIKIALGMGIGPGLTSCLYFAFSLFFRPRNRIYWGLEALILAALLVAAVLRVRNRRSVPVLPGSPGSGIQPRSWISFLLLTLAGIALLAAVGSFTIQSLMQPHGIQDAWNIWNMRARFLYRGAQNWKDIFSPAMYWLNHPDYPFLVTAGTARAWNIFNQETTLAPMLQAGLYAASLAGLLFSTLSSHKSLGQAALALLMLVGSSWFVLYGAWQIADIPLDYFIVASLFLLVTLLTPQFKASPGLLFLFGLTAGLAAWTKNEGQLFLVIVLSAWLVGKMRSRPGFANLVNDLPLLILGLLLPLAVLLYLKFFLAPPSDLFAGQSEGTIFSRITDLSRYGLTLSYLWRSILGFSDWGFPILLVLALSALLFLPASRPAETAGLTLGALTLILLAAGYFAIYLITPHDLVWHLRTSTNRLVFHLYPPFLLLLFWTIRTPEEVAYEITSRPK